MEDLEDYKVEETICKREDIHTFDIVRVGCAIQTVRDTPAAAAYLAGNAVPLDVARRVLLHPEQRRKTHL